MSWRFETTVADEAAFRQACAAARWHFSDGAADIRHAVAELKSSRPLLVKRGDRRAVYRIDLPGGVVYAKHRQSGGWLGRLVDRIRGAASWREFLAAEEAQRRGIHTTPPLASGVVLSSGLPRESILLTQALPDTTTLESYLSGHADQLRHGGVRAEVIRRFAEFVADIHESGLEHRDLHAGNILVAPFAMQFYLLDLDRARLGRALSWRATRRNLAMLLTSLRPQATPRDVWRFWRAYTTKRSRLRLDRRRAGAAILRAGARHTDRTLRERDRRSLRCNREFEVVHTGDGVALAQRAALKQLLAQLLRAPENPLHTPAAEPLKLSYGSVVVKTHVVAGPEGPRQIVYKRLRAKTWWKRLLALLRPSRARVRWHRGHALLARGIPTARPLFALEPRGRARWGESYLATEWIDDAENLHLHLWALAELPVAERTRRIRRGAISLGQLLGRMHSLGIDHGDLKGCNLAVVDGEDRAAWHLLDLEGMRFRRGVSFRQRAENLARLAVSVEVHAIVSRTDRMRFLLAYRRALGQQDDVHEFWRAVAVRCQRHLARLRKQGRAVA